MRIVFVVLGWISLGAGMAGIFLPLVPTTPLLLLAAALWVRSSPRLYLRLVRHPQLGVYIRNYREHRAVPRRVKAWTLSLMWCSMLWCIFSPLAGILWAQAGLAAVGAAVTWHVLSLGSLPVKK